MGTILKRGRQLASEVHDEAPWLGPEVHEKSVDIARLMRVFQRIRTWTMRLPNVCGLGQAQIHSSLFIMLLLLSGLMGAVGLSRPGFEELVPAMLTLPLVWVLSLAVRVAAQQLVLGENSIEMEMTVGPSGNLMTDYEYLPAKRILVYSVAGQVATLALVLLGFIVTAAMTQVEGESPAVPRLLDFRGGWQSDAWASQIMWVNLFLFSLHLLPTVPFDTRASIFALFSWRNRNAQEPIVFRKMAELVSHLSMLMLGAGLAMLVLSLAFRQEIFGWYVSIAAAVYLFVAGQWESARAEELEAQYAPVHPRKHRRLKTGNASSSRPHLKFRAEEPISNSEGHTPASSVAADPPSAQDYSNSEASTPVDVDEILRKLHRDGRASLSRLEQEALLSASRVLQERRGQNS